MAKQVCEQIIQSSVTIAMMVKQDAGSQKIKALPSHNSANQYLLPSAAEGMYI